MTYQIIRLTQGSEGYQQMALVGQVDPDVEWNQVEILQWRQYGTKMSQWRLHLLAGLNALAPEPELAREIWLWGEDRKIGLAQLTQAQLVEMIKQEIGIL